MALPFSDSRAPRVSVIIPAFNAEHSIGRALASVFAQTWRAFEVIVVDDGSTDGTRAAVEPWSEALVYVRQANGGPGRARNAGIGRARGELVAFLDADDFWLPDKLERQVEYFGAFPATGLLHTAVFLGDPGELAARRPRALAYRPPRRLFCEIFETDVEIHTLSVMVPRAVFDVVGGFDQRREIHVEDWDLWLRIAAAYPVGYIPCPLAVHHEGGVMSDALDRTFEGQLRVLDKALPLYRRLCASVKQRPKDGATRPRVRAAWELGYARLARNETRLARRAFRDALRSDPTDLRSHVYHVAAHLPPAVLSAIRKLKRGAIAPRAARVAPAVGAFRIAPGRRSHLVQDTVYRRARHRGAERLHRLDNFFDTLRGRPRRILFEAASPLSFVVFRPLHRRLAADPRIEFYYTSTSSSWPAEAIFRSVGIHERVIPPSRASWMKFDACINTDFYEMTWLHRCAVRLHLFHGVAGKYGIDSPVHVAPDIAAFDALLFPNADRLDRYLRVGLVDERAALLVGFPKIDCLVDGSLDRTQVVDALGLGRDRPTILYAPTWSPDSSLHTVGEAVVANLVEAGCNVLVKLHDRSYDLTRRASGGIDWTARFSVYAGHDRVRVIRDPDASPALMAADVLVTDHSSIGFEYAVLDRPIVVIDAPALLQGARINPAKVEMLRAAAKVITGADQLADAVLGQLADPSELAAARKQLAELSFYRPGTATDRAVGVVYDAIGLEAPDDVFRRPGVRQSEDPAIGDSAEPPSARPGERREASARVERRTEMRTAS